MDNLNKEAFIKTTFDSYKNPRLEKIAKEYKEKNKKIQNLTSNQNKIVKVLSFFMILFMFFFLLPIIMTALFTKGWSLSDYFHYILIISSIIIVHLIYRSI